MSKKPLSRRTLLRGAGGVALGLPFLEAMLRPGRTIAQPGEIPRRVVFFWTACGPNVNTWWPTGSGRSYSLGPALSALEPFKDKL
ncbi:MAG: DUF1552 domain-containing protein, partial [Myxococcota bacterium]